MSCARFLTPQFAAQLAAIDDDFWRKRRNGPLVIEVHYRGGLPQLARVRDVLAAPLLVEATLSITIHTTSNA